jgi:hypothetical protein
MKPQTREEKIAYLNGLRTGNRSLSEITEPDTIFLSYRNDQPGIVLFEKTDKNSGKYITAEEAEVLKAKTRANNIFVWEEHLTYLDSN